MLVHDFHREYNEARSLWIPEYCRAPLGLAAGSALYVSFHRRYPQYLDELILTPYPQHSWADLWRIELHLRDKIGQLEKLIQIFDANNISVLYEASRDAFEQGYHLKTFMIDCQYYESDVDGHPDKRALESIDRLVGLEHMILLQFSDVIRISEDGRPRLMITRNLAHQNLSQALKAKRISEPQETFIERGGRVDVRRVVKQHILPEQDFYTVLSANTKSHVIYCSIAKNSMHSRMHHLVIWFEGAERLLATILDRLKQQKLNIARSLLREGKIGNAWNLFENQDTNQLKRPFTLNIFIVVDRNIEGDLITELKSDKVISDLMNSKKLFIATRPARAADERAK